MLVLMAFSVFFWALFEQAASSVTCLQIEMSTLRRIPAGMFQALNPFFIVLFAPVFAYLWAYLAKKNIEPNTGIKFALAILLVGVGFMALVLGANFADKNFKVTDFSGCNVFMSYVWRALPFTCGFINGFKIISDSNCGANDGYWFLSSSLQVMFPV